MEFVNMSHVNDTMRDVDALCKDPAGGNTTCNKQSLGINLSTPILMLSTGVLGNVLALVVLYTSKKEVRKTVFFTMLAGLAWTDVIGQMCAGPIAIITYANNLQWQGGDPVCKYHGFTMVCFGILTPLLVLIMSMERVLALRFSYFYARVVTVRKAQFMIVGCWIFTLSFCTLPFMGLGTYALQFPKSWCFLNFHRQSNTDAAFAYLFSIMNILVISLIFVANCIVVVTLLQMRRTRRINNSPSIDRRLRVSGHRHRNILEMEMETQMVWFLGAITIVFCTCYVPLNVHILTNQITGQIDVKKDLISIRLASINQILDPWLYILLRKAMFFKFLRRVKQFVAQRKRPSSSRRHFAAHTEGSQNGSFAAYQLHSVSGGHHNSHHSLNECVIPEKINTGSAIEATKRPELRDTTLNGSSDSESDVFVEPQIRTKASFISIDEYIAVHKLKRRESSDGGDINGNKKLKRLYSLPVYLKATENDCIDTQLS
ncbi:prostaglandin E2 receptor EP3 subtype-like [Haliotis cracherodii]|uniref:prostaglandin E2 receptor EP3 subtype-like n=1 Tax=Haliotis cracherodii TaxID=6455 RepID=UPI0039EBE54D